MRSVKWSLVATAVVLSSGCAGGKPPAQPAPVNLQALESEYARDAKNAGVATKLGIAYYDNKQFSRARDVLQSAVALGERNYTARVYLGLTHEELGQLDSARAQYSAASGLTSDARKKSEIQDRLTLLTRKELRVAAREAIAKEATLSNQPAAENAVAVFPFRYVGSNTDLAPLGRGLTQLMIGDLAKVSRLKLLERERVQALVDEMALTESGKVDPASGARSGRMLRASRVMQGSIQDLPTRAGLRLDAAVVSSANAGVVATGTATDQLQQLFAMQKQVLFRIIQQLGITLSPEEQRALSERPTADLQAFLAYSRGLEAEDRGDWQGAAENFGAAVARDPNFKAAKDKQAASQSIVATLGVSPPELAGNTGNEPPRDDGLGTSNRWAILRDGVLNTSPSTGGTVVSRMGPAPVSRQPTSKPDFPEATGGDGVAPGLNGTIIIIITRP